MLSISLNCKGRAKRHHTNALFTAQGLHFGVRPAKGWAERHQTNDYILNSSQTRLTTGWAERHQTRGIQIDWQTEGSILRKLKNLSINGPKGTKPKNHKIHQNMDGQWGTKPKYS